MGCLRIILKVTVIFHHVLIVRSWGLMAHYLHHLSVGYLPRSKKNGLERWIAGTWMHQSIIGGINHLSYQFTYLSFPSLPLRFKNIKISKEQFPLTSLKFGLPRSKHELDPPNQSYKKKFVIARWD